MAKVTGPLFSLTASGSVGSVLTYAGWKGVQYVRELVIPVNKKSEDQGDFRLILGGCAKACAPIVINSDFYLRFASLIPGGQSWISYLVQYMAKNILFDAAHFEAIVTELTGHSAISDWISGAADANLHCFDIAYKGTTSSFSKQMQLYMLAKYGFAVGFATSPFDTELASWTATEIDALVTELTNVA